MAQHLQITFQKAHAKEALKKVIPSMEAGFNINTVHGDLSLQGDDARAVMNLITELALRRAKAN